MTTRIPTLAAVLSARAEAIAASLRVALPGKIVSFDASTGLASVQPLLMDVYEDEEGARQTASLPVVVNVPCQFPGGGKYRITFPVEKDDPVWLIFGDSSLDRYIEQGGEVDPGEDGRHHHLTDAIALLGVRTKKSALKSLPTDGMTIGHDEGPQIKIDGSKVTVAGDGLDTMEVGASDLDLVALATATNDALNILKDAINDFQINIATDGGPLSGTVSGASCSIPSGTLKPATPPVTHADFDVGGSVLKAKK